MAPTASARPILVFTPNTCLDITVRLESLALGAVGRASDTRIAAGGKGVNVCRSLSRLGSVARLVGLASAKDGRLERLLAEELIDFAPVPHIGDGRVAIIMLEDDGRTTVVNGRGPQPPDWDPEAYLRSAEAELQRGSLVICSGSLPPSPEQAVYAEIIARARRQGLRSIVDTSGEALVRTLEAGPDFVTPNIGEAEAVLSGRTGEVVDEDADGIEDRCVDAAVALRARGAVTAVVTGGRHGVALATGEGRWWVPAVEVEPVNPVGSGDSFVAGLAHAVGDGASDLEAVRFAASVGTAACMNPNAGEFSRSDLGTIVGTQPEGVPM